MCVMEEVGWDQVIEIQMDTDSIETEIILIG